jgi:hypothetical protein
MRIRCAAALAACVVLGACTPMLRPEGVVAGKPIDEFVNELKDELTEVHWRIRSARPACGSDAPREVDLRQGAVVLTLERVGQAAVGGDVRLVALPLGSLTTEPSVSLDAGRRVERSLVMKLEVAGAAPLYDLDTAPPATRPVALALNAAIDGFMRSQSGTPCMRLTALKLTLVLDVEQKAGGGFRITVPAVRLTGEASTRAVNTLTLEWAHVQSNGFL